MTNAITVQSTINAPLEKVWEFWTAPTHITQWNSAAPEWHTPRAAESDLQPGGKFTYRMEARDGSIGFDFGGIYEEVLPLQHIAYTLGDGRKVQINFTGNGNTTTVSQSFEPENTNSREMQQSGWQAIMDNFKRYTESINSVPEVVG